MEALNRIFQMYEEGYAALLLTGRSIHDLVVDPADKKLRTLLEVLRRSCRERYGMVFLRYSMAGGLDYDKSRIADERDLRTIESALQSHGLMQIPQDQNEAVRVIRGIYSLSRTPVDNLKWADGKSMRLCALLEFGEHLTPGELANGTQTDAQIVAIELANLLGHNLALRLSGNLVMFNGRDGLIDELVGSALTHVRLPQPDADEKRAFLEASRTLYTQARFEEGLTGEAIANLTRNTPNRGFESRLRASHRSGRIITAKELAEQKNHDVEQLSEHTLTVLDTTRVDDLQLCGANIAKPRGILEKYADGLLHGDRNMPLNILLVGAPGTGKTDLAILTARRAKAAAYQLHSPKGGIVGETERKVRLQWNALNEWGGIAFSDEITEALPLQRSEFDGDSGASRAVTAALLTELSNESARGRRLLIATTNCPWRMGAAMRSRFTLLPVLHPLPEDFAGIIISTAKRIKSDLVLDASDPKIQEAATVFYAKGANPRHIRSQLSNALYLKGTLTPDTILFAAHDLCQTADIPSTIYSDLWAVKSCTSHSFLPWSEDPSNYPFPEHFKNIVNAETGNTDVAELDKRLKEYQAYANV